MKGRLATTCATDWPLALLATIETKITYLIHFADEAGNERRLWDSCIQSILAKRHTFAPTNKYCASQFWPLRHISRRSLRISTASSYSRTGGRFTWRHLTDSIGCARERTAAPALPKDYSNRRNLCGLQKHRQLTCFTHASISGIQNSNSSLRTSNNLR